MALRRSLPEVIPVSRCPRAAAAARHAAAAHLRTALPGDDPAMRWTTRGSSAWCSPARKGPIREPADLRDRLRRQDPELGKARRRALYGRAAGHRPLRIDRELARHPDGYRTVHADFEASGTISMRAAAARWTATACWRRCAVPRAAGAQRRLGTPGQGRRRNAGQCALHGLPFAPNEKQALLECGDTGERARMLETLLPCRASRQRMTTTRRG